MNSATSTCWVNAAARFLMRGFESSRPSQPSVSNASHMKGHSKTARYREVSQI